MSDRSALSTTRNPLLVLPAMDRIRALPEGTRAELRHLLLELAADARARAEHCWRKHKAPMAAYWKAVAVYAKHTSQALRTEQEVAR